jgi:peptide/nickel transport system permease protein
VTGYIVRRCVAAVIIAIGVAAVSYGLLNFAGGSPVYAALGTHANPKAVADWNRVHGFDKPLIVQIGNYVWNAVQLKFGYSYKQGQSVAALLDENAGSQRVPLGERWCSL